MDRPPKKKYPLHATPKALSDLNNYCDHLEHRLQKLDFQLNDEYNNTDNAFRKIVYIDGWKIKTAKIRNRYIDQKMVDTGKKANDIIETAILYRLHKPLKSWWNRTNDEVSLTICNRPYMTSLYNKIDILEQFHKKIYTESSGHSGFCDHWKINEIFDNYDIKSDYPYSTIAGIFSDQIWDFIKNIQNELLKKQLKSIRYSNMMPMIIKLFSNKIKNNGELKK